MFQASCLHPVYYAIHKRVDKVMWGGTGSRTICLLRRPLVFWEKEENMTASKSIKDGQGYVGTSWHGLAAHFFLFLLDHPKTQEGYGKLGVTPSALSIVRACPDNHLTEQ